MLNPGFIGLGHELFHAYQDENRPWLIKDIFFTSKRKIESEAMLFENYLRDVFDQGPHRKKYGGKSYLSSISAFDSNGEKVDINSVKLSTYIWGGNADKGEGGMPKDNIDNGTSISPIISKILEYMDKNGIQKIELKLNQ